MIRAFIALELPDDVRVAMGGAQAQLKQVRLGVKVSWSNVVNLHLTLQFLGDVNEPVVEQISQTLAGVAGRHAPFNLPVGGVGAFPDERRARVVWVGCDDSAGKLKALAAAVQAAMQPLGFAPERREFSAHLTLGRIKFPRPDAALTTALDSLRNQAFGTLRVEAVHLFQSQLHPEGSIYTKLSSHQLGEPHHGGQS